MSDLTAVPMVLAAGREGRIVAAFEAAVILAGSEWPRGRTANDAVLSQAGRDGGSHWENV